jgi:hypothetical protein
MNDSNTVIWLDSTLAGELCTVIDRNASGTNLLLRTSTGDWWIACDRTL